MSRPNRSEATDYHEWYYNTGVWGKTTWMGIPCLKWVGDMWNYQEILFELKPSLVIEFGTYRGGSALFFASIMRQIGEPFRVLSVDIDQKSVYEAARRDSDIVFIESSSTNPAVAEDIRRLKSQFPGKIFAILDSDHSMSHVLAEMKLLRPLLSGGDYVIVEDSNINGHPVLPGWGPGPYEAIEAYEHEFPDDYIHDLGRENKLGWTFAPSGFLIRKGECAAGDVGVRDLNPGNKFVRDRELLPTGVERSPENALSVFNLASSHFDVGDFANARKWYARRVELGGGQEEVYVSMLRLAESMARLGTPWWDVEDAYLRAWEFRPTRAEPLYALARRYREEQRYPLGYLFARRASEIPLPEEDRLFVRQDVYDWLAADERAVCASWINKHAEAFTLWRGVLARPDVPEGDRQRVAGNRDVCVPTMIDAASLYPEAVVRRLVGASGEAEVVVSLVAGPDLASTEGMLNSFLNCCTDVARVGCFLVVDAGMAAQDRAVLAERYGFVEFADPGPARLAHIRAQIDGRFWLHLGQGWRFFAPENFIARLTAVLRAESEVLQVGVNFGDAVKLTGACAAEDVVCRAPGAGRYVLTDALAKGPAMFDTARLDQAGGVEGIDPDPLAELGRRAAAAGLRTASLDEVLCVSDQDYYRELPWTTSVTDILNGLLTAGPGHNFAELSTGRPSPYFDAVVAESKVSVGYRTKADPLLDESFMAADPPEDGYHVIFVDTWHEPTHSLDVIERCLPKLSADGALVVHGTNPPTAWDQRVADEQGPGSDQNGQIGPAVVEFRIRHPHCEVFTVDTGWGCTVIRPSRRVRHEPGLESVDPHDRTVFERERERLLNLVDIGWFRRHLYADPYLAGSTPLADHTEVLNVLIAINGLDSYLEIGVGAGLNLAQIIAPIRHSVDPGAALGGSAMYQMTSEDFFAGGLGLPRYDLIFVDGLHTEEQCRRDLENALTRLSDRGWIVAHDVNPPTEWHQRPLEQFEPGYEWNGTAWKALVRFRSEHPELEVRTLDLDWGCALVRRRAEDVAPEPVLEVPDTLDWAFFAEHRRELLNLVAASTEELPDLLCSALPCTHDENCREYGSSRIRN